MPLVETCLLFGFKHLVAFVAENLVDNIIPGLGGLAGEFASSAAESAATRNKTPYWEIGRAYCNECKVQITRGCVSHCVTCGDFDLCANCLSTLMANNDDKFHAANHYWTLYLISKTTCGYANMDNGVPRPSDDNTQDGLYHCTGYYLESAQRHSTAMDVRIHQCQVSVGGTDSIGSFIIKGERRGNYVTFKKKYCLHTIEYQGRLLGSGMLVGSWSAGFMGSSPFVLMFERANTSTRLVDSAIWAGHYKQFFMKFSMSVKLDVYPSGRIEGRGKDSVGSLR
ncbi:hypothetical protein ON010_g5272 [Phytophthora cinnamomi]|nr:hypothetical protein ON010_g5272 [Phytophthora cinnamomi]